jgi:hypothetical protein
MSVAHPKDLFAEYGRLGVLNERLADFGGTPIEGLRR